MSAPNTGGPHITQILRTWKIRITRNLYKLKLLEIPPVTESHWRERLQQMNRISRNHVNRNCISGNHISSNLDSGNYVSGNHVSGGHHGISPSWTQNKDGAPPIFGRSVNPPFQSKSLFLYSLSSWPQSSLFILMLLLWKWLSKWFGW